MSDPPDLDALRKLAAEATPAPWTVTGGGYHHQVMAEVAGEPWEVADCQSGRHDAAFIAACRTQVPLLIAEMERARERLAMAEAVLRKVAADNDPDDGCAHADEAFAALEAAR